MDAEQHAFFQNVVGRWTVRMSTISPDGRTECGEGLQADKRWFGGERYVGEMVEGEFAGARHEKMTLLTFNRTRDRFEYVTADNHDGVLLLYASSPGTALRDGTIAMFADYAMPDETDPARASFITIRTTLSVRSADTHILRNAYRYPGGVEKPFLEYVYTRVPG